MTIGEYLHGVFFRERGGKTYSQAQDGTAHRMDGRRSGEAEDVEEAQACEKKTGLARSGTLGTGGSMSSVRVFG